MLGEIRCTGASTDSFSWCNASAGRGACLACPCALDAKNMHPITGTIAIHFAAENCLCVVEVFMAFMALFIRRFSEPPGYADFQLAPLLKFLGRSRVE